MRRKVDLKMVHLYVLTLFITWISIVAYAFLSGDENMKDGFIDVEKEVYSKGEKVRIELKNDGSARWSPLSQYLKIYHEDSGELVYDGHQDIAMPAVPKTQTFFWNQTDMDGRQVPAGRYKAVLLDKYEVKFEIRS